VSLRKPRPDGAIVEVGWRGCNSPVSTDNEWENTFAAVKAREIRKAA
jgi:hypothetical protein